MGQNGQYGQKRIDKWNCEIKTSALLFPRYPPAIPLLFLCYCPAIPLLFLCYFPAIPRYSLAIHRYSLAIPPPLFAGHVHNFIPQNESMQQVHFMIKSFSTYSKKMIWIFK